MMATEWGWAVLGMALSLLSLPGTVELTLLTLGGLLPNRRPPAGHAKTSLLRLAVVIPAHDEEAGIDDCVASVLAAADSVRCAVFVVADNCNDATAERAEAAGAAVLVRQDPQQRGKGYALDYAFKSLLAQNYDAFIVVDADTRVESALLDQFQLGFQAGADALQCRYRVDNPTVSLRTRLLNVALLAFNVLRPRGRERWGLSVGLLGNGFGLTRGTLQVVPYEANSIAEDLEYHLRLVRAGRRVRFVDNATVWSAMPSGGAAAGTQRSRWEGGRLRMIGEWTGPLLRDIAQGRLRLLEPLLELLLLPLAFHVLLLVVALLPPFSWSRGYALVGLALVGVHVLAAIRVGGGGWRDGMALLAAPFYILWKLTLFKALVGSARKDAAWVRTAREDKHDNG